MKSKTNDNARITEFSLLILGMALLIVGMALVYLAKIRNGEPSDSININTATINDIALKFEIDPQLAEQVVSYRNRHGSFAYTQQLAHIPLFTGKAARQEIAGRIVSSNVDPNIETANSIERKLSVPHPTALRIVSYRDSLSSGHFKKPSDLLDVPIIDEKVIQSFGNRLVARGATEAFGLFVFWGTIMLAGFLLSAFALRKMKVGGDPFLLPISFVLAGLGVLILYSIKDPLRDTPVFIHHIQGLLFGLAAMVGVAKITPDVRRGLRRFEYLWATIAIGMLLILRLFGSGPESVRLSVFGIQPVEIIKILLILFVAGYLARRSDVISDSFRKWKPPILKNKLPHFGIQWPRWQDIGPIIAMYFAALGLFLVIRDMGPALVLFGAFISIMYIATNRVGIAILGVGMMALSELLGFILHVGVVPVRIDMWLSPWNNSHPAGMQLGQALWGMSSGGIIGTGLGLGSPVTMPRSGSDLVFASLGEELGLIGAIFALFLFTVLLWRGLKIAVNAHNDFDRLFALGLTCLIASEVFFIVAGVTGLLPLTGITLPFVSYGNSAMLAALVQIGFLRAISSPNPSVQVGLGSKPLFERSVRNYGVVAASLLLGLLGIVRLGWVQGVMADVIAGKTIKTPDADKVARGKINPRLFAIEKNIERGDIIDRKGVVLATSRLDEMRKSFPETSAEARGYFAKGRYYPKGEDFAYIVGYVDPAVGGHTGIEKDFNNKLRGFDRYGELMADYKVKDLPGFLRSWLTGHAERKGQIVQLTLDSEMQHKALRILKERAGDVTDVITNQPKNKGAMVVLDPLTGETLVSASIPSFNPNALNIKKYKEMLKDDDKSHRLMDRSRNGYYPPGSTLKALVGAIALENNLEPSYDCVHYAQNLTWAFGGQGYGRKILFDDKSDPPHNEIKMSSAMTVSCNLYFANLGIRLGLEKLQHGLSDPSAFGLSKVKPVPTFATDLPMNAFGQGTMVATPTEMARSVSAFANKGQIQTPMIVKACLDVNKKVIVSYVPKLFSKPISPKTATKIGGMLKRVTKTGTAKGVFDGLGQEVSGKTGTAQTDSGDKQPHSWFMGYAPSDNPKFAFSCVLENGGYGKTGAARAMNDMLQTLFSR